uniref:Large ribosomal subunit protein uL15/eL18 domain-containing protein n=1 Tax=Chromera velia CCMP2878 TaxID=1169474 RepID=A0A0G4FXX9_9ALVE|eukprot:Cvel_19304.t1-p1 / transcript=Cvel_19304.t1 / gene=Cvel_19304 / organism=Chromera_velia_CCMP2878 / gene_product=54S ribosomal protein L10, mitochondrial, putative / transcript_product=54S ribosomal protein L10, mitochondrial, putative / location=Cvel_scaffold1653:36541-40902(+) / protein_length=446 / sequence_SO=supercontig / SO=protein_coding / is_pseudo=false
MERLRGTALFLGRRLPSPLCPTEGHAVGGSWWHIWRRHFHTDQQWSDGTQGAFKPHPFTLRFAVPRRRPFFPITENNLRDPYKLKRKKQVPRGRKSGGKGQRAKWRSRACLISRKPYHSKQGPPPLYQRIPKWRAAHLARQRKGLQPLSLRKLRYFIEGGRLDARFPITQRHLHDSRCARVKTGVRLFNPNDYPFPYKIDIEVAGADQSAIDQIRRVGGSVTIVYLDRVGLKAHLRPYKFEVLPRTARPNLEMVHFLEKMRARGCFVRYVKPQWLLDEEARLRTTFAEFDAEEHAGTQGEEEKALSAMYDSDGRPRRSDLPLQYQRFHRAQMLADSARVGGGDAAAPGPLSDEDLFAQRLAEWRVRKAKRRDTLVMRDFGYAKVKREDLRPDGWDTFLDQRKEREYMFHRRKTKNRFSRRVVGNPREDERGEPLHPRERLVEVVRD